MAGSRRRYLAEQDAFMRDVLGYEVQPVSKMGEGLAARYTTGLLTASERARPKVVLAHPRRNPMRYRAAALKNKARASVSRKADELAVNGESLVAPIKSTFFREEAPVYATVRKAAGAGIGRGNLPSYVPRAKRKTLADLAEKRKNIKPGPTTGGAAGPALPSRIKKADPLKTHMGESDAKRVVGRVGLAGPLPKTMSREQRMGAYEARYVASGGRKGEKWQRRAERSDRVKTVGLGVATLGGAGVLATRAKPVARMMGAKGKRIQSANDTVAIGGATLGGAAELDAARARRKRSSYASAPGGVAASALRRMRAMDDARRT